VAFSPDGTTLASGGLLGGEIARWEVESWRLLASIETEFTSLSKVVFSRNGRRIAAAGALLHPALGGPGGHGFSVRNAASGDDLSGLLQHPSGAGVSDIEFSPAGLTVAAASSDGTVQLWETRSFALDGPPIDPRTSALVALEFSRDGARVITASRRGTVSQWSTGLGGLISQPAVFWEDAFTGDGALGVARVGLATQKQWFLTDAATGSSSNSLHGPAAQSRGAGEVNGGLVSFGYRDSECDFAVLEACESAFHEVWDLRTLESVARIGTCDGVGLDDMDSGISDDGTLIAITGCDRVELWNLELKELHGEPLLGMGTALFVDVELGERDGRQLLAVVLTTGTGATNPHVGSHLWVWDVTAEPSLIGVDPALSAGFLEFTNDGLLISPEASGEVAILDPLRFDAGSERFDRVQVLAGGHVNAPASLVFVSADQSMIATASPDAAVLWDVPSGRPLVSFGENLAINLDPLGRFVRTSSWNPDAGIDLGEEQRTWSLDPELWRTRACVAAGRNLTQAEWEQFLPPGEPYRAICPQWPALGG
jgi:WD40 repeat protein